MRGAQLLRREKFSNSTLSLSRSWILVSSLTLATLCSYARVSRCIISMTLRRDFKEAGPRELNKASKCYANLREWNVIFDIIDFICITFTFLKKIKSV